MEKQIPRIPIEYNYELLRTFDDGEEDLIKNCFERYWRKRQ